MSLLFLPLKKNPSPHIRRRFGGRKRKPFRRRTCSPCTRLVSSLAYSLCSMLHVDKYVFELMDALNAIFGKTSSRRKSATDIITSPSSGTGPRNLYSYIRLYSSFPLCLSFSPPQTCIPFEGWAILPAPPNPLPPLLPSLVGRFISVFLRSASICRFSSS